MIEQTSPERQRYLMLSLWEQSYPVLCSHRILAIACLCVPVVVTCLSTLIIIIGTFFLLSLEGTAEKRYQSTSGNGIQVAPKICCLQWRASGVRLGVCCVITSQGPGPISGNSGIIFHRIARCCLCVFPGARPPGTVNQTRGTWPQVWCADTMQGFDVFNGASNFSFPFLP